MPFASVAGTSHHGRLYVPVDDRTLSEAHYRSVFPGEAVGLNERYGLLWPYEDVAKYRTFLGPNELGVEFTDATVRADDVEEDMGA